MSYIGVVGAGSWGTALANLLAEKEYDVSLWSHEKDVAEEINRERTNSIYLPHIGLSQNVEATDNMEEALRKARFVINVVPTQFVRTVFTSAAPFIRSDAVIITASKGIEHRTLMTVSAILEEMMDRPVAALSGPSFAVEVARRMPTAVTVASRDQEMGLLLQDVFNTDYFRVYTNSDVLGVELGGALKNVMAIASGISDGIGHGASTRAALITRGLAEMIRLGVAMGADQKTFGGLSGLGDLVLTCTGALSRNYTVGCRLGKGEKLQDIVSGMKMIAEGVATARSAQALAEKCAVEMPIIEQIYSVIHDDKDPRDAVRDLMTRSLKSEY